MAATFSVAHAQYNNSGISAGFFDSSENNTINFSTFHLPPLAVLYENAKQNPQILSLNKAQEIAQAEVAKQKRHIFSYVQGHASYSYGKTDMWGNNNSTQSYTTIYQFQGSEQSYWNVGVNVSVPLEDILDLSASVKRKKLEVDQARIAKDIAFDNGAIIKTKNGDYAVRASYHGTELGMKPIDRETGARYFTLPDGKEKQNLLAQTLSSRFTEDVKNLGQRQHQSVRMAM